jgi:hypothetical protein
MSTVVLFYVLVPRVGVCHCPNCECCNHSDPQEVAVEVEQVESSCCSHKSSPKTEKTDDETKKGESDSCPCVWNGTPDVPVLMTSQPFSLADIFSDNLKTNLLASVSLQPTVIEGFVSFYDLFESPTSRLSVRLHLLLLVILN